MRILFLIQENLLWVTLFPLFVSNMPYDNVRLSSVSNNVAKYPKQAVKQGTNGRYKDTTQFPFSIVRLIQHLKQRRTKFNLN